MKAAAMVKFCSQCARKCVSIHGEFGRKWELIPDFSLCYNKKALFLCASRRYAVICSVCDAAGNKARRKGKTSWGTAFFYAQIKANKAAKSCL